LNLRGFLKYLRGKSSDSNRIDKTLEAIAECDKYISIKDQVTVGNDKNGQDMYKFWNYQIKENFPFLSFYHEIKKVLPEKFAANLLKDIALELENRIEDITAEDLKYEVTSRYYNAIANHFWSKNNLFGMSLILNRTIINLEMRKTIINYQAEILTYLNHRKQKEILLSEREWNYYSECYHSTNLLIEIEDMIDTSDGNGIISIHEIVEKSGLSWSHLLDIIELIGIRYKDKYTIVDQCLIPNSKIEDLKTHLAPGMRYKDTCIIFANNNIPAFCHAKLIYKLGFDFDRGKNHDISNPVIIKGS
jgi:hypothetical protein